VIKRLARRLIARRLVTCLVILAAVGISALVVYGFLFTGRPRTGNVHPGALEIRNTFSGRLYGRVPFGDSGGFAVEFTHSVNQSPVRESFRVENGRLFLESVRFYSFGAGMQSDLEEGQTLSRDNDAMIITGFNISLAELNLITGIVSDHLLIINNEIISLRELAGISGGENSHITIRYR